jgi:cbb3-type cytochrome c oxidase subunit I
MSIWGWLRGERSTTPPPAGGPPPAVSASAARETFASPEDREGFLRRHFGSGHEGVTGFGGAVYEHEDRAARVWLASSVFWFVVVTTFGMIIAIELVVPEVFKGVSWLVFSRARPVHVEGVVYAWLSMMYWGAITYFTPRLLGTKGLWSERLGVILAYVWNGAIIAGFIAILTGHSQGREWAEFPWPVDVVLIIVFILLIFNTLMTVNIRHVRPLYVSMWWAIAAPIWVACSIFIENVVWKPGIIWYNPSGALTNGIHDAMINWWGNHNLFGLWLTPILVAVVYYFVPRITNTPLYSHTLGLISFWGLIFIYAAVGDHHLLQSPTPGWLKTIASVNSVALLIPVTAFFANIFLTMRGQWNRFFTNLPLRFILTGFVFYILANLQGSLMAVQPFNIYIHFTYFIVAHSHLALLGAFTILGFGVINYMLPYIWEKQGWSRALAEWQYWLVTFGFVIFFFALVVGAFIQGQGWMIGQPEVNILPTLRLWNVFRAVGGAMIYLAGFIQLYVIVRTYLSDPRIRRLRRGHKENTSALKEQPAVALERSRP